jgi:undecaprenyl-diphosphatase
VDYAVDRYVNEVVRHHHLLVSVVIGFSEWGVIVFGVAACLIWLLAVPGRDATWKRACAAGLVASAFGLLVNQVIGHAVDRARPYEAHPHTIVPLLTPSHDPSFPSDHATAAFAVAFGVLFVHRRAGWVFLSMAALIAASRVLAGMHYPSDVLAGALVGLSSGYVAARIVMRALLVPLIALVSRVTDPVVLAARRSGLVRRTLLAPRIRVAAVAATGGVLLVIFALDLRAHLLDELPLTLLALWAVVVVGCSILAAGPRDSTRGRFADRSARPS